MDARWSVEAIETFLREQLGAENSVRHVAIFLGSLIGTSVAAKLAQWVLSVKLKALAERSSTKVDDILLETFERPLYYIVLLVGARLSFDALDLPPLVTRTVSSSVIVAVTVLVAWSLHRLVDSVYVNLVRPWVERTDSKLDDHIVPVLQKALKLCIWTFSFLICFSNLGVDVFSLVTGLGLGGLAVAMAAQDTLANVFGSVTIFADRPFQVADLVQIGEHKGVVESVGLRASRIRTLQGALVNIPNKEMTSRAITNLSDSKTWRYDGSVGLVYGTSIDELKRALEAVREILAAHPAVADNFAVRFMRFADSSLQVDFAFFVTEPAPRLYLDTIGEVNLAIKERFDAEGWEMAFPSLTLYMAEPLPPSLAEPAKRRRARVS